MQTCIIVSLISRIIKTIPVTVRLNWIKSHQDADKTAKKLTVEAQMKIKADVMASNFLERCPSVAKGGPRNSSNHFPTMQPSLIINNQWMRQGYKVKKLQYLLWGKTWKERFKISFYPPGTTETMNGRILKAIEQQNQLGLFVTLRGYLGKGWRVRFTIQRKIGNQ